MPSYLNSAGNSIGSLLRFIQEQKSQSPIIPAKSETASPIRGVVQQPLSGSEGQGTSKVVSVRPEGTLTPSGQPIELGTPQSSRVGPISIGGADVDVLGQKGPNGEAPASVVAKNEPGTGFTVPSATRTVGDVVNKSGAASGQGPGLGTAIKAAIPETIRGQQVQDYTIAKNTAKEDIRTQEIRDAMAAGDRSTSETTARMDALAEQQRIADAEYQRQDDLLSGKTLGEPALNAAREQGQVLGAMARAKQNQPAPTTSKAVQTPGLKYVTPPKTQPVYSKPQAVNVQKAVSSGGLSVQKPAAQSKAPSLGTIIGGGALQAIKKLFGW